INAPEELAGQTAKCPKCGSAIAVPALAAVVAAPTPLPVPPSPQVVIQRAADDDREEQDILKINPAMFRDRPIWFCFIALLVIVGLLLTMQNAPAGGAAAGAGALIFLIWWLKSKSTTLTVTNKRTIYRRGLLAKYTREVRHAD